MRKGQSVTANPSKSKPIKEKLPASIVDCTDEQLSQLAAMPAPRRIDYRRKITEQDLTDIAKLIAKRLTATEACHVVGVNPKSFFEWKSRKDHEAKFTNIFESVRGNYINSRLAEIEASASGEGVKQRDWRASAWLAQVSGGERYNVSGKAQDVSVTVNQVADQRLEAVLKRLYDNRQAIEATVTEVATPCSPPSATNARLNEKT